MSISSSRFTGSDIDIESLTWAKKNVDLNSDCSTHIRLLRTEDSSAFQRALLDYIHSESSVLEVKESKRRNTQEDEVNDSLDVVEENDGNESGDEGVEGNNGTPLQNDLQNQLPITQFLISQFCSHIGDGNQTSSSVPPIPPAPTPTPVDSSQSPSLLQCFTGPVRCAITASGIQEAEAATRLERAFVRNNAHLLYTLQSKKEQRSVKNGVRFSSINSKEAEQDTAEDTNENKYKDENKNKSQDEDIKERLFYTACMTNPPFYDEDEKVRCLPSFSKRAAFLCLPIFFFLSTLQ
jgi:hypothetical protein